MRLLKVICNAATGNTVFEFGGHNDSYDWEKSVLLADCLSQVFYNTTSTWSGNIEVYFELKGKNYCAGRKTRAGKIANYLAGEVKGKLLLLAFDYESFMAYLNDEVNGDFGMILTRCFVSSTQFDRFINEPSGTYFGFIKEAQSEKEKEFDMAEIAYLTAKTSRAVNQADVMNLKNKVDNAKKDYDKTINERDQLKQEINELSNAVERKRKSEALIENRDKLLANEEEIEKLRKKTEISNAAKEADELNNELKNIRKELDKCDKDYTKAAAAVVALNNAKNYAENNQKATENNKKLDELKKEKAETEKQNAALNVKIDALTKERDKALVENGSNAEKAQQTKQNAIKEVEKADNDINKATKELEILEKNKADCAKEKIEAEKSIDSLNRDKEEADRIFNEINAIGFTDATYKKAVEVEEQRKKDYDNQLDTIRRENQQRQEEAQQNSINNKNHKAEYEQKLNARNNEVNELTAQNELLSMKIEEAKFDIDPKNFVEVNKKYFGMGFTPMELYQEKKALKNRIVEMEQEYKKNEEQIKQLNEEISVLNGKLDTIAKEENKQQVTEIKPISEPAPFVPVVIIDEEKLSPVQQEYVQALKNGKGDSIKAEKQKKCDETAKAYSDAKAKTENDEKNIREYENKAKAIQKNLDDAKARKSKYMAEADAPVEEKKEFVFDKQNDLDNAIKNREENNKKLNDINNELQSIKPMDTVKATDEEKKLAQDSAAIPQLILANEADKEKNDKKRKELQDKEKQLNEEIHNKEIVIGVPANKAKELIMSDEELFDAQKSIDEYYAAREYNENELNKLGDIPDDIVSQIATKNAQLAECENAIIDKNAEVARFNDRYETKQKEYDDYINGVNKLAALKAVADAIPDRKFQSNKEAENYLVDYNNNADKLLKKMTGKRLGMKVDENIVVYNDKKKEIPWDELTATDKLLVYVACAQSVPILDGDSFGWIVIDGNIEIEKQEIENALTMGAIKHNFEAIFEAKEKTEENTDGNENAPSVAKEENAPMDTKEENSVEESKQENTAEETNEENISTETKE